MRRKPQHRPQGNVGRQRTGTATLAFVLFVMFVVPGALAAPSPMEPFERALALYARGDLQDARVNLEQVLKTNPWDHRACRLLQVVEREAGRKSATTCDQKAALPQPIAAPQLFQAVVARNPEIGKAVMEVVQARSELRMAKLAISPEFSVLGRFYPSGVLLSLTQSLFGGFFQRQANIHLREANLLAAVANYAKVRDDVLDRAADSYFGLRAAQEQLSSLEDEVRAATELHRVALLRVQHGTMLEQQRLQYARQLGDAQFRVRNAKSQVTIARATLNALMSRSAEAELAITPQDVATTLPADYQAILEQAQQHRPQLQQALRKVEAARAGRQVALRDLPKIDLRGSWGSSDPAGRGEFLTGPSVGVRATIPLLILPMQKASSRREQAIIDQLEFEVGRIIAESQLESISASEAMMKARSESDQATQQAATLAESVRVQEAKQVYTDGGDLIRLATARVESAEATAVAMARKYAVQRAAYRLQRCMGLPADQPIFTESDSTSAAALSEAAMQNNRGMWVWKPEFLENQDERNYLVDFAATHGIATLFLSASANSLSQRSEAYHSLIAAAHARNVKVEALQGEPDWALTEGHGRAERWVDAIVAFNAAAPASARFDGIHLDVEPHTLAAWKSGEQERIGAEFADMLDRTGRVAHDARLTLAIDIHPNLERVIVGGAPLLDRLFRAVDAVAIMAYWSTSEKVLRASAPILQQGATAGKRIWVGLSADRAHLGLDADSADGDEQLESIATAVESSYRPNKAFAGVAIHDYTRYRNLILGKDSEPSGNAATRTSDTRQ